MQHFHDSFLYISLIIDFQIFKLASFISFSILCYHFIFYKYIVEIETIPMIYNHPWYDCICKKTHFQTSVNNVKYFHLCHHNDDDFFSYLFLDEKSINIIHKKYWFQLHKMSDNLTFIWKVPILLNEAINIRGIYIWRKRKHKKESQEKRFA